ncbi:MAG TPA: DEAD/DEAH box helicase [Acidimicrobiales bacterium]|nr:DEAD/DEAH box helicase [Acidimicrobiales bacterium]
MTPLPPATPGGPGPGSAYPFELDDFQRRAVQALDEGASVLVAAPTGSGKTVVAEHAVARALAEGGKAFYTTPIKALSNQKFADLARRHGARNVGLLTGDNSINGDAPVVVMTTEVLRNMIYARSPALDGLRFVVLDEVHYLQDTYRGPVWEEVIIHVPASVALVCLSATVSNAEELADWLTTVRGPTRLVLEERRPVELRNLYLVGDRQSEQPHLLPTLVDGHPNREADRLDDEVVRQRGGRQRGHRRPRRRLFTPRRPEVVEMLDERDMLPALYFIFSRMGCEEAVASCLDAGLRLTTPDERARIRAIVDEHTAALSDDDLDVLGYDRWSAALEMGLAAHHAGMVPPFKEAVEACFVEGLVKAVFATETLALGVNMPARTVVIERLTKFTGEARAFLTPGEYTQLTGRAGRRGIDDLGYAIVLWSPFVPFDQVASLASSRTYGLRSAFRPTYNMAANLVHRYQPPEAHHLLNLSFAQFQADKAVVRFEARIERQEGRLAALEGEAQCERGDVGEYRALMRAERAANAPTSAERGAVAFSLARLLPGDVVAIGRQRVAVLSVAHRKGGDLRLKGIDAGGEPVTLTLDELPVPPERLGRLDLPRPYQPNNRAFQHKVADELRRSRLDAPDHDSTGGSTGSAHRPQALSPVEAHPVDGCPDRDRHVRAHAQMERAQRELADMRREVRSRTGSLARRFDRVLRLMEAWGYLEGWSLTAKGEVLARTYHESDLLVAEALTSGLLDGLDPAALAGLLSCFTYEHRGPGEPEPPWFPSRQVRARWSELERLAAELQADEEAAGLPPTRAPDPGFAALAHAWAAGEPLGDVLGDEDLSGGDFVRNVKTLIDLVRQVGVVAPVPETARAARQAAEALHRGVVSISSTLDEVVGDGVTPEDAGGDGEEAGEARPAGAMASVRVPRDAP